MPELPEVETTVKGLRETILGLTIKDVWTDIAKKNQSVPHFKETLKSELFYKKFKKNIIGKKITFIERRAKNILIHLSNKKIILIHMKMTGHLLYGLYAYSKNKNQWEVSPQERNGALRDPYNRFIHVVFSLNNKKHLALCDSRKFAKVTLIENKIAHETHFKDIGPEPLDKEFSVKQWREQINTKPKGKIKQVLMDQKVVAGIGNIYSDEMLWLSNIHPLRKPNDITDSEFKLLFKSMKTVLMKGITLKGDSTSDYRTINGTPGKFSHHHHVYRLTGKKCAKKGCTGIIKRIVVGTRSAHFCNIHQK